MYNFFLPSLKHDQQLFKFDVVKQESLQNYYFPQHAILSLRKVFLLPLNSTILQLCEIKMKFMQSHLFNCHFATSHLFFLPLCTRKSFYVIKLIKRVIKIRTWISGKGNHVGRVNGK